MNREKLAKISVIFLVVGTLILFFTGDPVWPYTLILTIILIIVFSKKNKM